MIFAKWFKRRLSFEKDSIQREISRSRRFNLEFGVLLVEVDNGVSRGLSKCLPGKTLSFHVLKKNLRAYDEVIQHLCRRYYIILPQTDKIGTQTVRRRIYRLAVANDWRTVFIGAAVYPQDGETPQVLLDKAESELVPFF